MKINRILLSGIFYSYQWFPSEAHVPQGDEIIFKGIYLKILFNSEFLVTLGAYLQYINIDYNIDEILIR